MSKQPIKFDRAPMTENEVETLRLAVKRGYFAVPRETSLVDLSNELGRSDRQVSEEVREGMATVLRRTDALDPSLAVIETDGRSTPLLDGMFDILKHPYRRQILMLVSEHNPVDEDEYSVEALATDDDDLELLTTELYHVHLPKLSESGYIEWDQDEWTIRRGPNFEEIAPLLRLMHDHQDELPEGWP